MKIGIFSPDSKKGFPNLASMKLSSYYKKQGHEVNFLDNVDDPDKIFVSIIFPKNRDRYYGLKHYYPDAEIVFGGSGINYDSLPFEIEHCMPDYDLYGVDYSMGFTTRGCIRDCSFCIVREKEGFLRFNAELSEFIDDRFDKVTLLDNNPLGLKGYDRVLKELIDRDLKVDFNQGLDIRLINDDNAKLLSDIKYYNIGFSRKSLKFAFDDSKIKSSIIRGFNILTNNGIKPSHLMFYILADPSNVDDALERTKLIISLGSMPYIMKLNQLSSPELNKLARWVNRFYYQFIDWKDYSNGIKVINR